MLPSFGLLRNANCPFYSVGLCTRPFCHFGHIKKDGESTSAPPRRRSSEQARSSTKVEVEEVEIIPVKKEPIEVIDIDDEPEQKPLIKAEITDSKLKKESSSTSSTSGATNGQLKTPIKSEDLNQEKKSTEKSSKHHHHHKKSSSSSKDRESSKRKHSSSRSPSSSSRSHHHKSSKSDKSSKSHSSSSSRHRHSSKKSKKDAEPEKKEKDEPKAVEEMEEDLEDLDQDFEYSEDIAEDADEIAQECLQMFNEYSPEKKKEEEPTTLKEPSKEKSAESISKKRVAHDGADEKRVKLKPEELRRPKSTRDAVEVMLNRLKSQTVASTPSTPPPTTSSMSSSSTTTSRKRISSVGNVQAYLNKPVVAQKPSNSTRNPSPPPQTFSKTNPKGEKRTAHLPVKTEAGTPQKKVVLLPDTRVSSKVPFLVRQLMLDRLYQECLKVYPDSGDAVNRALLEESELASRCKSKLVYQSSATNTICKIRKTEVDQEPKGQLTTTPNKISHEAVLAGSIGLKHSWSVISSPAKKGALEPHEVYKSISRYLLNEEELIEHGYPRIHPNGIPGNVVAKLRKPPTIPLKPDLRICDRCAKEFSVDKEGFPTRIEECVYHHGRRYKKRVNGLFEGRLSCCDGDTAAEGCSVANTHVPTPSKQDLTGFVSPLREPGPEDGMGRGPWDIIGLDCEMIYTTHGPELARVTVVAPKFGTGSHEVIVIYNQYVKTTHPVLDYNTRFSGINEEHLKNEETTLPQVQAVLLANIRPNSILIGHSLESDLLALKFMHNSVVDTSVIFPHKMGLPFKRALRTLSSEILGRIIQVSEFGHDSAEDAIAAVDLVLWKIKNSNKDKD